MAIVVSVIVTMVKVISLNILTIIPFTNARILIVTAGVVRNIWSRVGIALDVVQKSMGLIVIRVKIPSYS